MNTKIILGSLAGAVLIHSVLAACTSNTNASAQSEPSVQVVSCDKTFALPGPPLPIQAGGDGGASIATIPYAEAAYPGLTANQIAGHVTNWRTVVASPNSPVPTGYGLELQTALYVRDGFAGAGCAGAGTTTTFVYVP